MKMFKFFLWCSVGFLLTFKIGYAVSDGTNLILYEVSSRYIEYNDNPYYVYSDDILNNNFYRDIDEFCSFHRTNVNRRKFGILRYVMSLVLGSISIIWTCCGFMGLLWLIWAINRLHTGGAIDHD